jgi:probable HAF family extracellular repeat protein
LVNAYLVEGSAWTQLLPLPGHTTVSFGNLSNDGTVVGRSRNPSTDESRAALWRNGTPFDLGQFGSPGLTLEFGRAISEDGVILVNGEYFGSPVAVLLAPIPPTEGDTDCNSIVDIDDLLNVINSWGPCPLPPMHCPADLDGSDAVNIDDLLYVINSWTP